MPRHATLASRYDSWFGFGGYSPSRVNFMIFNSVWTLLVLIYVGITPLYLTSVFHRLAALALNAITTIFWFAGSIALAVFVGGPYKCGSDSFCGSAEAAVAFGFFLWALFTFLTVIDAIDSLRSRGHNVSKPHAQPGA
ncbi:membrane-associating domain-containing protein [Daldinia decipiens]|uniref:membrane-associating domain-containing protein n=1 Tax=Daldinia decipiens TaxID=326647 RepID=UPI0020C441C9|nr:membrane-associating domain-containing protein [Daldinia decipiens]KAI1652553.1 membrane-associating domain-containing protein [Daldinia decipiens]